MKESPTQQAKNVGIDCKRNEKTKKIWKSLDLNWKKSKICQILEPSDMPYPTSHELRPRPSALSWEEV